MTWKPHQFIHWNCREYHVCCSSLMTGNTFSHKVSDKMKICHLVQLLHCQLISQGCQITTGGNCTPWTLLPRGNWCVFPLVCQAFGSLFWFWYNMLVSYLSCPVFHIHYAKWEELNDTFFWVIVLPLKRLFLSNHKKYTIFYIFNAMSNSTSIQ